MVVTSLSLREDVYGRTSASIPEDRLGAITVPDGSAKPDRPKCFAAEDDRESNQGDPN
jgi:hypothetical protein